MRHPLLRVQIFLFLLCDRLSFLNIQIYNLLFPFCFFEFSIIFSVYCESGAIERNVTPGSVSTLVVKVVIYLVEFDGLPVQEGIKKITEKLKMEDETQYKIRDWVLF